MSQSPFFFHKCGLSAPSVFFIYFSMNSSSCPLNSAFVRCSGKAIHRGFLYLKTAVSGRQASCPYVWLTNQSLIIPSILSKLLIYNTFVSVATFCRNIPSFCYSRLCHHRKYTKVGSFHLCYFLHDHNNEHWLFVVFSSQQCRAERPLPHPRPPPPSQQGWMA